MALITTALLCVLMSTPFLWDKVSLKEGEIASEDLRAHQTISYQDSEQTRLQRDAAARRARKVYKDSFDAGQYAQDSLQRLFDVVAEFDGRPSRTPEIKRQRLHGRLLQEIELDLPEPTIKTLMAASPQGRGALHSFASELVEEAQGREIRNDQPDDLARAREDLRDRAAVRGLPAGETAAAVEIAGLVLRPNRILDAAATQENRDQARASVAVYQDIKAGELIIGRGTVVRKDHLDKLQALGLMHRSQEFSDIFWICVLTIGMMVLLGIYLFRFQKPIFANFKLLLLLALVLSACVIGLKVSGTLLNLKLSSAQLSYLGMMWVAAAGMLVAMLLNSQLAILLVALLSVQGSLTLNNDLHFTAAALASGLCGIFSVTNIKNRSDWLWTAAVVSGVNLLTVWIFGEMRGDSRLALWQGSIWAVSVGAASTFVFWFGVAMLERPFGIATHIRLLELSDPNNPVLRKLLMEAPGTYHHSIVVGNLAESAAEAVGADSMLVRVASYYHDIGKTRRPHYFVENQHVENVHDSMNPTLSTLVITSHVKDGVELGREFKLPPQMLELIAQHHGTGLVTYFYHQAAASDQGAVMEEHFRYEGPRPQTREAAILMLADAVEAAARSIDKPTLNKIEGLVNRIVRDRQADGQLDECDLTFRDLERIIGAFVRILVAMYHSRIEYPESPSEAKKTNGEGNSSHDASGAAAPQENGGHGGPRIALR